MKKYYLSLIIAVLIFPGLAGAADSGFISFGEGGEYVYTDVQEEDGVTYYFNKEALSASTHDTDGNGKIDIWLGYKNDVAVIEGHDTDGNGEADIFFQLDADEAVTRTFGDKRAAFDRPDIVTYEVYTDQQAIEGDLVGDVSSISIPGSSGNWVMWLFLLVALGGGGYWWWKNKMQ